MIRSLLLWIAQHTFNPRGKHFLLRTWDRFHGATTVGTPTGIRLKVRLGSSQDLTFLRDPASDHLAKRIAALPVGAVFVDVGANIGYYSILAKRVVGDTGVCIACEPSRREFARLTEHLSLNRSTGVLAINAALGDKPGVAMLRLHPYHTGLNDVVFASGSDTSNESVEPCLVATCDDILATICPGRDVDLLKVDVEGAELEVLKGTKQILSAGRVRALVVEITDSYLARHGHNARELYEFMEGMSYRGLVGLQDTFQYDEVFVRTSAEGHCDT